MLSFASLHRRGDCDPHVCVRSVRRRVRRFDVLQPSVYLRTTTGDYWVRERRREAGMGRWRWRWRWVRRGWEDRRSAGFASASVSVSGRVWVTRNERKRRWWETRDRRRMCGGGRDHGRLNAGSGVKDPSGWWRRERTTAASENANASESVRVGASGKAASESTCVERRRKGRTSRVVTATSRSSRERDDNQTGNKAATQSSGHNLRPQHESKDSTEVVEAPV